MKKTLLMLTLLVIGLFALGWWLGWYSFSTRSNDDQVKFGMTVNKTTVKEHEEKAKEKISQAGQEIKRKLEPGPAKPAADKDQSSSQQAYIDRSQARLDDLGKKMEDMRTKGRQFDDQARAKVDAAYRELQARKAKLQKQLEEYKDRTAPEREKLKKDLDAAFDELQELYEKGRGLLRQSAGKEN